MVSIKATAMAIMLLTFCLLATQSAAYHGCCRSYMEAKLPFAAIRGYSVQTVTEMCHINAIIFLTRRGKACCNPALTWVMDYVNKLRNKAQMVHIKSSQAQK
ncbi:C-C motif chemokine 20a.3 [Chaetodon auriga]|uniref:C-C motif chemokine 20a.3 n=1 Tax=Chaetodon auriga TaxID=39042 RepID=UPI004033048C